MANYTPNYRLHQWEPEDKFLRTDFNEDFSTIDAALGKTERSARASAYNVYNLMLQSDYEGKYTGYKKALLFDGFLDENGIAEKSPALVVAGGAVSLSRTGQSDLSLGYQTRRGEGGNGVSTTAASVTGNGRLTGFRLRLYNGLSFETDVELGFRVMVNEVLQCSGQQKSARIGVYQTAPSELTFSPGVPVRAGDRVRIELDIHTAWEYELDSEGKGVGGTLRFTPVSGSTGTLLTRAQTIPACQALRAWVRHKGGAVSLQLVGGDGSALPMTPAGERQTVEPLNGTACTERAFALEQERPEGPASFRLDLSAGQSDRLELYDYGVVLL